MLQAPNDPSNFSKSISVQFLEENIYKFYVNDTTENINSFHYKNNKIDTTKYNFITFIPKALLIQFVRLANIYFLVCAILQCIPIISPLTPVTAVVPLVFVLSVSIIREGIEDYSRAKLDKQQNNEKTTVYRNGQWEQTTSGTLYVGEIVEVLENSTFPADLILIDSELPGGICFIETGTLDGEKTLKQKESPRDTREKFNENKEKVKKFDISGEVIADMPNPSLYQLNGRMKLTFKTNLTKNEENPNGETHRIPLDAKQLLLKELKEYNIYLNNQVKKNKAEINQTVGINEIIKQKENIKEEEEEEDEEDEEEKEENEAEKSLLPKCPADTELVSIFKNNIFFEDYFMSFCDQYLNVITASLFKMFNSKLFSIKNVENKKIKEEMGGISISGIGGAGNASSTQEISATVEEGDNSSSYTFHKKKGKNHFAIFKHILGTTTTEDLKVKISSYYTDNCVMNIKKLNLASKKIASSIISHFIISAKKDDKDHPNNYWSLTSANAKEEYFRNMRNVSFKSYDKNYNLDFFETDDQKISLNNKSNKNIADMINKYFDYIQKGKGQTGTFLPELIGIFKVKINDFNTMLIFISRNSIVYNVPKNFYTYWQLLRFDNLKPQKIATSKCRGTLVTEESLFERLYESDIKKNKDMNKVMLKNYSDFKEIIGNDINFLKDNNLLNVNLLMMYYEYENTQKHEKEGAIQIRKTDENKAEIINIDLPGNANNEQKNNEKKEKKEKELKQEKKEKELKQEKKENDEDVLNIGEIKDELNNKIIDDFDGEKGEVNDIFGDEEFDFMPDLGKDAHNLLDYTEKVNIAGYEGNFDNFVCMCFFTFENAFDINNRSGTIANEAFKNKILENFSEFKQK